MANQWYAVIYKPPHPFAGTKEEVRSYGTVITDPLNTVLYEAIPIDNQPQQDEEWDPVQRKVVSNFVAPAPGSRDALRIKPSNQWSNEDIANWLKGN